MAGQRTTYQNIQTYTRNEVRVPLKLAFHPGTPGNTWLMLVAGHGISTTAAVAGTTSLTVTGVTFSTQNGGSTTYYNSFALSWPERYATCVGQHIDYIQQTSNDTAFPLFYADFTAGTSTSTPSQSYVGMAVVTSTALLGLNTTAQTYILYLEGVFELGR